MENKKSVRFCCQAGIGSGSIGDIFQLCWQQTQFYKFILFPLLIRVLDKTMRKKLDMMLMSPFWSHQIWFPVLMEISWDGLSTFWVNQT